MINSFSQYLVEENKVVYFIFSTMNPPTVAHGQLLDKISASAGRNPYKVFLTQSQDDKKNPLSYSDKIKSARKMFPKHARSVMVNKKVNNVFDALVSLYDEGFRKVVMVAGSDKVNEYDIRLNKFNGKKSRSGFYNFMDIKVISAGIIDPDSKSVDEKYSANSMRSFAESNDFVSFSQGLPKNTSTAPARKLFNDVRKGLGLKENNTFKNHIQLETLSQNREDFIKGDLFELGESVIIKKTDAVGIITVLGSNYVIVEMSDGTRSRQWLEAVEAIEMVEPKKRPDEGTKEAGQKARKETPGQKTEEIKTRRSYTDIAKMRINREKQLDAKKHDRILDRARLRMAKQKNQETKPNA